MFEFISFLDARYIYLFNVAFCWLLAHSLHSPLPNAYSKLLYYGNIKNNS